LRAVCFDGLCTVVLLGLFYLHVWLLVNPSLIHEIRCPVFLTSLGFFKSFLHRPGGLVEYLSIFWSQFNYYPWAGALIITLTVGLICLATRGVLRAMRTGRDAGTAWLIPAVLFLLIYNRYEHDPAAGGQILAALIFVNVYARVWFRSALLRWVTFLIISGFAYYLIGGGYVLFAVLCGILELLKRRSIILGIFCLLCVRGVPAAFAMYSYEVTLVQAFAPLLPFSKTAVPTLAAPLGLQGVLHLALVLFFPLAAIWGGLPRQRAAIGRAIRRRVSALWASARREEITSVDPQTDSRRPVTRWTVVSVVLLIIVGALGATFGVDRQAKMLREVRQAARNKMWGQVLEKAVLLSPEAYDIYVMRDVNTALYHTGRLPYDMFAYPQAAGVDSILLTAFARGSRQPSAEKTSEVLYDLGFVNESEHFAHESLETNGPSPEVLKRLAKINILKGLPVAARTFLAALSKNLLYREWAQDYLRKLEVDPLITSDEELSEARSRMIRGDYVMMAGGAQEEQFGALLVRALEQQLRTEARNRKAFEHLMGYYLLARDLDKVVAAIPYMEYFEYSEIPRHYAEAALLYAAMHPGNKLQIPAGNIRKETVSRFQGFLEILTSCRGDKKGAYDAMIRDHDKSYFLFYTAGVSDSRFVEIRPQPAAITGATK